MLPTAAPYVSREECVFGDYEVSVDVGRTNRAVFAFGSLVLQTQAPQKERSREWAKTLAVAAPDDHKIFIKDKSDSWFCSSRGLEELISYLKHYCSNHKIDYKFGFGLSMGGTGALLFDRFLRFDRVGALAPQIGLGRQGAWDGRYASIWDQKILEFSLDLRADGDYLLFAPIDVHEDLHHLSLVPSVASSIRFFLCRSDEHNLSFFMRSLGIQETLVSMLLRPDVPFKNEEMFFIEADAGYLAVVQKFLKSETGAARIESASSIFRQNPSLLPRFMFPFLQKMKVMYILNEQAVSLRAIRSINYPLALGQSVRAEELDLYAVYGWHDRERDFIWSEGSHHFITFDVLDWSSKRKPVLRLGLFPFVDLKHLQQRLHIYLNGKLVDELKFDFSDSHGDKFLEIDLLVEKNEVVLFTPDCASLHSCGLGADTRIIAFSLFHLSLSVG